MLEPRRPDVATPRLDLDGPSQVDQVVRTALSSLMALDRDLLDAVKDLDDHELRRLMILTQAQLHRSGALRTDQEPQVHLRQQEVRCGKRGCTKCPHGPYWYAYWTENGKRKSRYVGRLLDEESLL